MFLQLRFQWKKQLLCILCRKAIFSFKPGVGLIFECNKRAHFDFLQCSNAQFALNLQLDFERMYFEAILRRNKFV